MCCSSEHGGHEHADGAETYPRDWDRFCACLGADQGHTDDPGGTGKCCGAASGDDGLCDRCRTNCNLTVADDETVADVAALQPAL